MTSPQLSPYTQLLTTDAVVIFPSRGKLVFLALGAAGFVVAGFFMPVIAGNVGWLVGIAAVLFFGFCLAFALRRLVRRTPALIIHPLGIFDNASALSAGFLPWEEIQAIGIVELNKQRFLGIGVKDLEGFLRQQTGFKARLMKINIHLVGAAINIPANTLPMSLEELIQEIRQKYPAIQVV